MRIFNQTAGMTVLEHGEMLLYDYHDLLGHLRDQRPLQFAWRLPEWIHDPALIDGLPSNQTMAEYHLFHDCGKPICRVVDAEGRQNFPDHAAISEAAWLAAGGDPEIVDLLGMGMDVHLLKGADLTSFSQRHQARALHIPALRAVPPT